MNKMSNFKPYLVKATYEWILDNGMTPQVMINLGFSGVDVPAQYKPELGAFDRKLVLNVSPSATQGLNYNVKDNQVSFFARFGGSAYLVKFPFDAIECIFSRENQEGNVFRMDYTQPQPPAEQAEKPKRPTLTVVK